jgi:hypothetical protein
MTIKAEVLRALQRTDRLCDDCLSEVTGVTPRQSINMNCRLLSSANSLTRGVEDCARCGRAKTVNRLGAQAFPAAHLQEGARKENPTASFGPTKTAARSFNRDARFNDRSCFLVSCVGKKRSCAAKASDLYISDWFVKACRFVERTKQPWFILSAEYGLVHPDSIIEPYERTLNQMGIAARRAWANRVIGQMRALLPASDEIVVFAGARYREFLMEYLLTRAKQVTAPLEGLAIGQQLSWFITHSPSSA